MPVACRKGTFRGQLVAHREIPGSRNVTESSPRYQEKRLIKDGSFFLVQVSPQTSDADFALAKYASRRFGHLSTTRSCLQRALPPIGVTADHSE